MLIEKASRALTAVEMKIQFDNGRATSNTGRRSLKEDTLLHVAAGGQVATVTYFLLCNVSLDNPNTQGQTSLHRAAKKGCLENISRLVERNASGNTLDKRGNTALHLATL